jgi:5,10-methylene-tetrahydrofolate dehydrogenase/methenyl tetrahydrofolate cyclohydrolase
MKEATTTAAFAPPRAYDLERQPLADRLRLIFGHTLMMLLRAARRPQLAICPKIRWASNIAESGSKTSRNRAELVNGRAMAHEILAEVRREVELMASKRAGLVPGLATILVGERKDSAKYVDMKQAVAKSVGFHSLSTTLPADATSDEVLAVIRQYNADDCCHGILLQLPVPAHLDARTLLGAIRVEKDVECFHPLNTGRLSCWRHTVIAPCTPRGIMEMLSRLEVSLPGKRAVVLGDSNVVGLPMVLMLNAARTTVTMVHQYTVNPEVLVREADIVVAACGVPELVKKVITSDYYYLLPVFTGYSASKPTFVCANGKHLTLYNN